jgi:FMN phosphatase YigB (HAD superfamily)
MKKKSGCLLFDWGNTLMKDFAECKGPMHLWPTVEAVSNAESVLSTLHNDWFIALATNAKDSTKDEIKKSFYRAGLLNYIDEIFCFRSVGYSKPSSEFFNFVLSNLEYDRSQVFMVGDDYQNDIKGSNSVGIRGIWLNTESNDAVENNFCRTIHNLSELPKCLSLF